MITRRSVRIKAMQYIYAFDTTQNTPSAQFQALLEKSILSVKDQYLYILLTIREVANFVEKDAKIKASKYIKSDRDKSFNTKLLSNVLVQFLNNDKEFLTELKNAQTASLLEEDNIRQLYRKLTESPEYNAYLENGKEFDLDEDRVIITFLLDTILLEDEIFTANTEEIFTNWMDDAEYVIEAVHEVIQKSKHELKLHLEKGSLRDKFKELSQFGVDLFNQTIEHKKEHLKLIEPKLKNWESDRLAVVDMILIRMAVAEFL